MSKQKTPTDLTPTQLQRAKEMYLNFEDISKIARLMNVSRQALS